MPNTKIEWTDKVWNPISGCTPISPGCQHCYAKRQAQRFGGRFGYPKDDPFKVTTHPDRLDLPGYWRKPCKIFVNSMGDLFHRDVSEAFIKEILLATIREYRHTYQILTKRPERMRKVISQWKEDSGGYTAPNVWCGVTVENADYKERIDILRTIPAAVRFISFEPLLGDVGEIDLTDIHWVIVGGETGPRARPMNSEWARSIRDQCKAAKVPFFFKKTGSVLGNQSTLDNQFYREFPGEAA